MPTIAGLRAPDSYLTNFSLSVAQDRNLFRSVNSVPTINVELQSGLYRVYDSDTLRDIKVKPVAPGTPTTAGDFGYNKGQYHCQLRGLHVDIDPGLRVNATDINLQRDAVSYLTSQMALEQENRFVNSFLKEGVWGRDLSGTSDFAHFDDAASDPISTVLDAILGVQITSGFRPNTMWVDRKTFNKLIQHPLVIDRINRGQTTGPAVANENTVASIFSLSKVIVIDAIVRDEEGSSNRFVSDNKILLAYVDSSAGMQSATAMAKINWVGLERYMHLGSAVYRMEVPLVDGTERLEIKYADHMVVTAPSLGVLLTDVLSK